MKKFLLIASAAAAVTGCTSSIPVSPQQGLAAVHVPVVSTSNYMFDAAAPSGALAVNEAARLDGWFSGLGLAFGDSIYVTGDVSPLAVAQVAEVAGRYGMLLSEGNPVAGTPVVPGAVRVIVSRRVASVPGCPDWSQPSNPNYANKSMSNFGCGVNSNLAAMVANPQDLISGAKPSSVQDAAVAAKAIEVYRKVAPTGSSEGSGQRPLQNVNTKGN